MKKISLLFISSSIIFASEFQIGQGNIKLDGGFLGLNSSIDDSVTTFTLKEEHKNLFKSDIFYKYKISWIDSDKLNSAKKRLDTNYQQNLPLNPFGTNSSIVDIPSMDYEIKGLDADIVFGYDIYKNSKEDYIGIGALVGISLPYIESQKKDSNNNDFIKNGFEKSKTKIKSFKIGPSINLNKNLNHFLSIYANSIYAFQTANIKNSYANFDSSVNGTFFEYEIGVKFQVKTFEKKILGIDISPKFYATLGYRYNKWKFKDVNIDISGYGIVFDKSDLKISSSNAYIGFGYNF